MEYAVYVGVDTMKANCGVYTSLQELFSTPFSTLVLSVSGGCGGYTP